MQRKRNRHFFFFKPNAFPLLPFTISLKKAVTPTYTHAHKAAPGALGRYAANMTQSRTNVTLVATKPTPTPTWISCRCPILPIQLTCRHRVPNNPWPGAWALPDDNRPPTLSASLSLRHALSSLKLHTAVFYHTLIQEFKTCSWSSAITKPSQDTGLFQRSPPLMLLYSSLLQQMV